MLQVTLPSDLAGLGEPLPVAEAKAEAGTHLVIVVEEDGFRTLKVVRVSEGGFVSATPNHYPIDDPRIVGFFPIKGSKGVNAVVRPGFSRGDSVRVRHQPDLGVCEVEWSCAVTDMEFLDGDVLTRVGYYVWIKSPKMKGRLLGYHEDNLCNEHVG